MIRSSYWNSYAERSEELPTGTVNTISPIKGTL